MMRWDRHADRNSRGMRNGPVLVLLAALFAACSAYKEVQLTDITDAELISMNASTVALRVDARIDNPNGYRIAVEDPDIDLFLNGNYVGKGVLDSALVLERRSARVYPVHLHADLAGGPLVLMLITGALNGEVKLGVKGTVTGRSGALRKRFPFEMEQTIDLSD